MVAMVTLFWPSFIGNHSCPWIFDQFYPHLVPVGGSFSEDSSLNQLTRRPADTAICDDLQKAVNPAAAFGQPLRCNMMK